MWNKDASVLRFIALKTSGCKKETVGIYGLSIRIATHKGAQVASQYCPILLVSKKNISNAERECNTGVLNNQRVYPHKSLKKQNLLTNIKREFSRIIIIGDIFMKKIEVIIRPGKFDIVKDALLNMGYPGMTVTVVEGHGNQKGVSESWRGRKYRIYLLSKIKIEITIKDADMEKIVNTITTEAQTGSIGDRISCGEQRSLALKSDDTVWSWGFNGYGQLGDESTTDRSSLVQVRIIKGVVAIARGGYYNLALKSDGPVWTWGDNSQGQLGDGTTTDRTTPGRVNINLGQSVMAPSSQKQWQHQHISSNNSNVRIHR